MKTCPVCDESVHEDVPRCVCRYHFETRDPGLAIEYLQHELRQANKTWYLGLALLVTFPLSVLLEVGLAPMIASLQLLGGSAIALGGIIRGHAAKRKVVAAKALMELPAARVVVSD